MADESSGMTKVGTGAKLEDSNMDNYGSQEHKDAKLAAAQTEKAWEGCGQKPGIEMWRIEKFKVVKKEKKEHGKFFDGDSYIILNTYKPDPESDKLAYNVHFWLGKDSSQDEKGTAAYKTVELDDLLGDVPVQYREVQGFESPEFMGCFGGKITIMKGGIESGFNKVKPEEYKPRLLWVKGKGDKVRVSEVDLAVSSLNNGDTFLMDNGLDLIVWNGAKAGAYEKNKAREVADMIDEDRNGKPQMRVLDGVEEDERDGIFWKLLGQEDGAPPAADAIAPETPDDVKVEEKTLLFELSDKTGSLVRTQIADKELKTEMLKSEEVFILDAGLAIYAWIGKQASKDERKNGIKYACAYIEEAGLPDHTPVIRVMEGAEPPSFKVHFDKAEASKQNFKVGEKKAGSTLGRKGEFINVDGDWALWPCDKKIFKDFRWYQKCDHLGNGFESLYAELQEDTCKLVWFRNGDQNVVLHWKGPKASRLKQVQSNQFLQKAVDKCPAVRATLEVTGIKNLNAETIAEKTKAGSGSKVIQD
jgi:gelsolin